MNFGYMELDPKTPQLELDPALEPERFSVQLYHHVAGAADLAGKDVLEVGSGRGGGSAYIHRYLKPSSTTGIDFSASAVDFCNDRHRIDGLTYKVGNAQSLPFDDHTFDVIVNVESSHTYVSMETFLKEVMRVLRPEGYFLFTDIRPTPAVETLRRQLHDADLSLMKETNISQNVVKALRLYNDYKYSLFKAKIPQLIAKYIKNYSGIRDLESGKSQYLSFVLQKDAD